MPRKKMVKSPFPKTPLVVSQLKPGVKFRLMGDEWEVVSHGTSGTVIRQARVEHVNIMANGEEVRFTKPGKKILVSSGTEVD